MAKNNNKKSDKSLMTEQDNINTEVINNEEINAQEAPIMEENQVTEDIVEGDKELVTLDAIIENSEVTEPEDNINTETEGTETQEVIDDVMVVEDNETPVETDNNENEDSQEESEEMVDEPKEYTNTVEENTEASEAESIEVTVSEPVIDNAGTQTVPGPEKPQPQKLNRMFNFSWNGVSYN
jgi:hypothetical protein